MAAKDLIFLGLTNNADGTEFLITWGMEAAPDPGTGAFLFKRDTNIYISKADNASANSTNTVDITVKDFSFNQRSSMEVVGRQTFDATENRGVDPHISAVSPISFSFVTYINPLVDTNVTSPEEYLWVSLMGSDSLTSNPTSSTIDFANGNVKELQNLTLWFDRPNHTEGNYRLDNAVVDSADISFGLNDIAEIRWSGRALAITEDSTPPTSTDRTGESACLKNKLSTILLNVNSINYNMALIGGGIRINNNNTFYGRGELGKTTVPTGHYTGKRSISGSLNFYLKVGTDTSVDLFNELLNNAASTTFESTYLANITVNIGGATAPNIQVNVPQALLDIGQQGFSEVITVDIPFTAKEESGSYSTIIYQMP